MIPAREGTCWTTDLGIWWYLLAAFITIMACTFMYCNYSKRHFKHDKSTHHIFTFLLGAAILQWWVAYIIDWVKIKQWKFKNDLPKKTLNFMVYNHVPSGNGNFRVSHTLHETENIHPIQLSSQPPGVSHPCLHACARRGKTKSSSAASKHVKTPLRKGLES